MAVIDRKRPAKFKENKVYIGSVSASNIEQIESRTAAGQKW